MTAVSDYQAFRVELADKIAHVQINRPDKVNAMNADFWREIVEIFRWVDATDAVRVVVLSGAGKHFSSGIDLMLLASVGAQLARTSAAMPMPCGARSSSCRRPSTPSTSAASRCWQPSRATAWAAPST